MFELSLFEVISLSIAGVSIIINIIQVVSNYLKRKYFYKPIYNSLFGLFNSIKGKSTYLYGKQNILFNPENPHTESISIKWNYFEFIQEIINFVDGIREHIVSILKTMELRQEPYRASEFGLTEEEKKQREDFYKQYKKKQEK